MPHARALHRREAFLLQRAALMRRASWGLQRTANFRVAHARAPLRWLSLGRRRRARACCTRAPCRAGCGRPMSYASALPRREAFLLRRAAVVRRGGRGLQRTAGFRVARARVRHCHGCLSGGGAARELSARACAGPHWLWLDYVMYKTTTRARSLSSSACGRGATCQQRPPTHHRLSRGMRAPEISLGRKHSTEACCARARCRACYGWSVPYVEKRHRR